MKFLTLLSAFVATVYSEEITTANGRPPPKMMAEAPIDPIPYTKVTEKVYMDIAMEGEHVGRFVFGMFGETTPKTVANFVTIANGSHIGNDGKALHYKGTVFHRMFNNFIAQGGDVTFGNGAGSESIYGNRFPDENIRLVRHHRPYLLGMANSGKDDNGSQFYVSMKEIHWDLTSVVFGELIDGHEVLYKMRSNSNSTGIPVKEFMITDCGTLKSDDLPIDGLWTLEDLREKALQ